MQILQDVQKSQNNQYTTTATLLKLIQRGLVITEI